MLEDLYNEGIDLKYNNNNNNEHDTNDGSFIQSILFKYFYD